MLPAKSRRVKKEKIFFMIVFLGIKLVKKIEYNRKIFVFNDKNTIERTRNTHIRRKITKKS